MDVVLTPTATVEGSWNLEDRLGRSLGTVARSTDTETFEITPSSGGKLQTIARSHPSLDTVMTAIAKHMQGACTLDSRDWD